MKKGKAESGGDKRAKNTGGVIAVKKMALNRVGVIGGPPGLLFTVRLKTAYMALHVIITMEYIY